MADTASTAIVTGIQREGWGDHVNNAGKTTPSGGRRRACRGARTYVIVGAALGAVFLHAPVAEANPGQPAVESGDEVEGQQTADAVSRLIRLADRAATIGTDPIAVADLAAFASSTWAAAQAGGVIADTAGPVSASAGCIVDAIARGVSNAPAQSLSCLAPLATLDPLLALRIAASLQVDALDPAVPHDGDRGGEQDPVTGNTGRDSPVPGTTDTPPASETTAPEDSVPDAAQQRGSTSGGSATSRGTASAVAPSSGLVTSNFGTRSGTQHGGVDIADSLGSPIGAAADGTVISAGPAQGFGLWVRIRHDDGSITTYGHNNGNSVTVGQRVRKGDRIAEVGNRGNSTGPHLHFEATSPAGQKVDPQAWLGERGARIGVGTRAR